MATNINFPSKLPGVLIATYGVDRKNVVRRDQLDIGPPIYRLVDDDVYQMFNVAWRFSASEMQLFRSWFRYSIANGSRSFNIGLIVETVSKSDGFQTYECYFDGAYRQDYDGRQWLVSATLLGIREQILDECDGLSLVNISECFSDVTGVITGLDGVIQLIEDTWQPPPPPASRPSLFDEVNLMVLSNNNRTTQLIPDDVILPSVAITSLEGQIPFANSQLFGFYFDFDISTFQNNQISFLGFTNPFDVSGGLGGVNSSISGQLVIGDNMTGFVQLSAGNLVSMELSPPVSFNYAGGQMCVATDGHRIVVLSGSSGDFATDVVIDFTSPTPPVNLPVQAGYLVNNSPPVNQADNPSRLNLIENPVEYPEIQRMSIEVMA